MKFDYVNFRECGGGLKRGCTSREGTSCFSEMWGSEADVALRGLCQEGEIRPILAFERWSECVSFGLIGHAFGDILKAGTYEDSVEVASIIERTGWEGDVLYNICRSIVAAFVGAPKKDIMKTARYWLDSPFPWNTKAAFAFAERTYETEQWEELFDLLAKYPERFDAIDLVLSNFVHNEDALRRIQRWTPAVLESDTPCLLGILEEALRLGRTELARYLLEKIPYADLAGHTNPQRHGGNFLHFAVWTKFDETRELVMDALDGDDYLKRVMTTDGRTPSQSAAGCNRPDLSLRLMPTGPKGACE